VDRIFISSVMRDYSDERLAAKDAVESLGLRAVMAETAAASADPAKSALLSDVERADAVVLLLASRYGYSGDNGLSPTEDEYNHAVKTGKPVLVFVQEGVEREPAQEAFIARVRGSWEQGVSTASFSSPAQLMVAVVKALTELRDTELHDPLVGGESTNSRTALSRRSEHATWFSERSSGKGLFIIKIVV